MMVMSSVEDIALVKQVLYVTRIEPDYRLGYVSLARSLGELGHFEKAWQAHSHAQLLGADLTDLQTTKRRLRELEEQSK